MQRAVFLDRDGVINRMVYDAEFGTVDSPATPDQLELLPNVGAAIAELNQLDLRVIVVSNQPGIAKGRFTTALLEATTQKLLQNVRAAGGVIDAVRYCLHHPEAKRAEYRAHCDCRKPAAGLLFNAAQEFALDLARSFMVGDGVSDILSGQRAGTRTIFVSPRKCYVCDELARQGVQPDYIVADLAEAVQIIRSCEVGEQSALAPFMLNCLTMPSTRTMEPSA